MIQDIFPQTFEIAYRNIIPGPQDSIIAYNGSEFLIQTSADGCHFPRCSVWNEFSASRFLFSISGHAYFLYEGETYPQDESFSWKESNFFRQHELSKAENFAGVTAFHLIKWYRSNRFCGGCGQPMQHSETERMLFCPHCGNQVYPKISPAVILAVHDRDKLLMSKYRGRTSGNYILLAGFVEVGESPEDAAKREVFEETGVRIKNLCYYRSQPWGYSNSLLMGYFAELDGDNTIVVQEEELSEAKWIPREEIICSQEDFSLTNDMIWRFKMGDFPTNNENA